MEGRRMSPRIKCIFLTGSQWYSNRLIFSENTHNDNAKYYFLEHLRQQHSTRRVSCFCLPDQTRAQFIFLYPAVPNRKKFYLPGLTRPVIISTDPLPVSFFCLRCRAIKFLSCA